MYGSLFDSCSTDWSEADRTVVSKAAEFRKIQIAQLPNAAGSLQLPANVIAAWFESGLGSMLVSSIMGGSGGSYCAQAAVAELLASECMNSTFALLNLTSAVTRMSRVGSAEQIKRYLPALMTGKSIGAIALTEPSAGSDFAAIKAAARKTDGGWLIDGEKAWVTNGTIADQFLIYAQTDPNLGRDGIGGFLVNAAAASVEKTSAPDAAGISTLGICGLRFSGCFVPEHDVFYPPGKAFRTALEGINVARTNVAALCCGMVAGALAASTDYGSSRHAFGKPIIDHQGLRWALADAATNLEATRLLTWKSASLLSAGDDAMLAAAHAKKFAVRMAERELRTCMQAMGAEGLKSKYPLARHVASAQFAAFVDGTSEIQNNLVGASLKASSNSRLGHRSAQ